MSGSGTNIGIEYQQRVSSWFLLQLYLKKDISLFLKGIGNNLCPNEIRYETETPIDDLVIICPNAILFAQIKHNLSLSDEENSDFYSVISQFLLAYKLDSKNNNKYLLITSSLSSRSITIELSKILDSIRLNPEGFHKNPLHNNEIKTYAKLKSCWNKITHSMGLPNSQETLEHFLKKIFIVRFDIENNQPLETATLLMISGITQISPELIWSILLKNSLEFASKRLSVSITGISEILKPYIDNSAINEKKIKELNWFELVFQDNNTNFESGVDCVYGRILDGDLKDKYCVLTLYRFDEQGNHRLKFENGRLKLKNGLFLSVIFRCSTQSRLTKYFESNLSRSSDDEIILFEHNFDIQEENNTVYAKAWSEKLKLSINSNSKILNCIHCSGYVSEHLITVIEYIDKLEPKVGVVHSDCRKGSDREIGHIEFSIFENREWLKQFNIDLWIITYLNSVNNLERAKGIKKRNAVVVWNDDHVEVRGKFCCGFVLSDNSIEYAHRRSKIESFNENKKNEMLSVFENFILKAKKENNPLGYLSKSRLFGSYSLLVTEKSEDEEIFEINSCFIDDYSLPIINNYEKANFYYAPIIYIYDLNKDEDFHFGQYFILITNPFELNKYFKNWKDGDRKIH
jgi:hypothetical protein